MILFSLLIITITQTQEKIKVVYSHQMSMDIESMLDENDGLEMKKAFKKALEEVHYYELISSPTESIYKKIQKINNDLPTEDSMSIHFHQEVVICTKI